MSGGFDGNGTYVRYYNWAQDAANSIPISSTRFDTEHNGFASALTNCITRDGQGKPTANIDWNTKRLINMGDPVNPQDAMTLAFANSDSSLFNLLSTRIKYIRTPAETSAGVTPVNYFYPEGNACRYGAIGDDSTDNLTALTNWLLVVAQGVRGYLPHGIYRYSSGLTVPLNGLIEGDSPFNGSSVLKPTNAVTEAVQQSTGSTVQNITLDGILTTGKVGLSIGNHTPVNNGFTSYTVVKNFKGTSAQGIVYNQGTTWNFLNSEAVDGEDGWIIGSVEGFPTNTVLLNCTGKQNNKRGIVINSCDSCVWIGGICEENGEEGIYCVPNSRTVNGAEFYKFWLEANQQNTASGAARHAKYEALIDGTSALRVEIIFRSLHHSASASGARNMHLTAVSDYLLDDIDQLSTSVGAILIDGASQGRVINWPEVKNGGTATSLITVTSPAILKQYHTVGDTLSVPGSSTLFATSSLSGNTPISIANNATATLSLATGLAMFQDNTTGACGLFLLGASTSNLISAIANSGATWTATSGSANNLNVTIAGGTVTIQNKTGNTASIVHTIFRLS